MKQQNNNKNKTINDMRNNNEGFSEGFGFIKKAIKKTKDVFMKPFNSFKEFITKPLKTLEDFIRTIICLAVYLELVFNWFSDTFILLSKYIVNAPICFGFWVIDSFVAGLQFIIIDILLRLLFIPAYLIGNFLGYPFTTSISIKGENRKKLYESTNALRLLVKYIDKLLDKNIYAKCFEIGSIKPFPKYHS